MTQNLSDQLRPRKLSDIQGQSYVVQVVKNMLIKGAWLNRLLLAGSTGTGKSSLAFILAKLYLCEAPNLTEFIECGECKYCKQWRGDNPPQHPKLVVIEATSQGGKDDAAAIKDIMYSAGGKRVLIIDECAELTTMAQTLLQVPLETAMVRNEGLMLIACTAYPNKLKIDFRHRFNPLNFKRISTEEVTNIVASVLDNKHIEYTEECIDLFATLCDGSYRGLLSSLDVICVGANNNKITATDVANYFGVVTADERTLIWEYLNQGLGIRSLFSDFESRGVNFDRLINLLIGDIHRREKSEFSLEALKVLRDALVVSASNRASMLELGLTLLSSKWIAKIPKIKETKLKEPTDEELLEDALMCISKVVYEED